VSGDGLCPDCGAEVRVWVRGFDLFPRAKPQPCTQPGCDGQFVWARTERRYDSIRDKWEGGKPAPVHWPFPVDRRKRDGTVMADEATGKVPNVGVRKDQHGMWLARVATLGEPVRANERPAFMHHVLCKNPPKKDRPRSSRPKTRPPVGQDALDLDVPGAEPAPGPLSDKMLFPRRRSRRGGGRRNESG
jgi:hypothetical protein